MREVTGTLRLGWVGLHQEGTLALEAVLRSGHQVVAVMTLTEDTMFQRSAAADYGEIGRRFQVPVHRVRNINDNEVVELLKSLDLDLLFVIGWSQILSARVLRCARIGVVGAHASLLPHNRGSAPVNWALISGEEHTGNTLFWLSEGVDEGDVIEQSHILISPYDTCATVYDHVARSNREMILRLLPRLARGERPGMRQDAAESELLPRRRPEDGAIDWTVGAQEVYNFVRALTRPYPGAFSELDGLRFKIWSCALLPPGVTSRAVPGEVLGSVVSPVAEACGIAVACGFGAVLLLEVEDQRGRILSGRGLSDADWARQRWTNGFA